MAACPPRDLEPLYRKGLERMRRQDFRRALPPLCRLLLALPIGHGAEAEIRSALCDAYHELGRFDDAYRVL